MAGVVLECLAQAFLHVKYCHHEPLASLEAAEDVSDQLCGSASCELFSVFVPVASHEFIKVREPAVGDGDFHVIGVNGDVKGLACDGDWSVDHLIP